MRGKEMIALARVVISKRERVIMLEAFDKDRGRPRCAIPMRALALPIIHLNSRSIGASLEPNLCGPDRGR
jgi:hypothetical protein